MNEKNNDKGVAKIKLVHLVYGLLAAAVIIGIAIGSLMNQQSTNTKNIQSKVSKEYFDLYSQQQLLQITEIKVYLEKIDLKLEKIQKDFSRANCDEAK